MYKTAGYKLINYGQNIRCEKFLIKSVIFEKIFSKDNKEMLQINDWFEMNNSSLFRLKYAGFLHMLCNSNTIWKSETVILSKELYFIEVWKVLRKMTKVLKTCQWNILPCIS